MNHEYAALAAILLVGATTAAGAQSSDTEIQKAAERKGGQPVLDLPRAARDQHVARISDPGSPAQGLPGSADRAIPAENARRKRRPRFDWGIAGNLDRTIIAGIAAYYAGQPPARGHSDDPALVAKGKELFDKGLPERGIPACMVCHGADATGRDTFPRLAGQHAKYVIKQLNYIQSLVRAAPVMHGIVKDLTPNEIQAVAAYVQSK